MRLGGGYGGEQLEFFRPQLYPLGDKTGHVLRTAKWCTEMWAALTCYLYIGVTKEGDHRRFLFLLDDEPGLRGIRVVTKACPKRDILSHHPRRLVIFPVPAASSAYHVCFTVVGNFFIRSTVARAYMGIPSGSPWVVPSWEIKCCPQ